MRVWRELMERLARWMESRYLPNEAQMRQDLLAKPWYRVVQRKVEEAERTKSAGEHKRVYVETAVKAACARAGKQPPPQRDLNLAIELAVLRGRQ